MWISWNIQNDEFHKYLANLIASQITDGAIPAFFISTFLSDTDPSKLLFHGMKLLTHNSGLSHG